MMIGQFNSNSLPQQIKLLSNLSLVLLLHFLVIWALNYQRKSFKPDVEADSYLQLFSVKLKTPESPPAEKSVTAASKSAPLIRQTKLSSGRQYAESKTARASEVKPADITNNTAEFAAPASVAEESPAAIREEKLGQADWRGEIRQIYRQTRKEFELRDKVMPAAKISDLDVLAQKIAASAQTNRVGVHYENFVLPNGRPVTKVNTPYGSYCILLDKPGENPDLRLPKVPVSCGKF